MIVSIALANLSETVHDPKDMSTTPMSTLIASSSWHLEAEFVNGSIGDLEIYRNDAYGHNNTRRTTEDGKPVPDAWRWWMGVPCGRIKSYRRSPAEIATKRPQAAHGEPKAKSGEGVGGNAGSTAAGG